MDQFAVLFVVAIVLVGGVFTPIAINKNLAYNTKVHVVVVALIVVVISFLYAWLVYRLPS